MLIQVKLIEIYSSENKNKHSNLFELIQNLKDFNANQTTDKYSPEVNPNETKNHSTDIEKNIAENEKSHKVNLNSVTKKIVKEETSNQHAISQPVEMNRTPETIPFNLSPATQIKLNNINVDSYNF